jgi:hypothetical protein
MQSYIKAGLIVLSAALLQSCTKVIDVKLKDSDKRYVVEGVLTDMPGTCNVRLSQTKNFSEDNSFNSVSGASLSITDQNTGLTTGLTETEPGVYTAPSYTGTSGHTYLLNVAVAGKVFTSSSTMPPKVNFDTLYMTDDQLFGRENKFANLEFRDPPSLGDCYQARQYVNGKALKDIFVTNDDYTNDRLNYAKLYVFPDDDKDKVKAGDTVSVDMLCIDKAVYRYWFSLQQSATGNSQSAAPANPVTNIKGGAIGYFTAQTMQTRTVIAE